MGRNRIDFVGRTKTQKLSMIKDRLILLVYSALLFVPFLGAVHLFDWDEINFAESAREMLLTGNWFQVQINFEPFWEKPPLFFWMQVLSMKAFGINEFAARFPNAICGIVTLQVLFSIGLKWQSRTFAWIWTLLYSGSILPFLYFKSGIIDPWFNLFIFLSVYHLFLTLEFPQKGLLKNAAIAGLFSGLAILTKGPVGLLLALLTFCVWLVFNRFKKRVSPVSVLVFAMTAAAVSCAWFGYEVFKNGPWFLKEFIEYQIDLFSRPVAGHSQPFYYHFVVVLIGCFPSSLFAIPAFSRKFQGDQFHLSSWMKYLFWVVMILFSIVTTKIVHYSSMSYIPLTYLAALYLARIQSGKAALPIWLKSSLATLGYIIGTVIFIFPILLYNRSMFIPYINDVFVQGNLSADIPSLGIEWIAGLMFLATISLAIWMRKATLQKRFLILSVGISISLLSTMVLVVPMIEAFSQRSLIRFFKSNEGPSVVFVPAYFKTYAHYFYGKTKEKMPSEALFNQKNTTIHPVFVICKAQHKDKLLANNNTLCYLFTDGGYVFFTN